MRMAGVVVQAHSWSNLGGDGHQIESIAVTLFSPSGISPVKIRYSPIFFLDQLPYHASIIALFNRYLA